MTRHTNFFKFCVFFYFVLVGVALIIDVSAFGHWSILIDKLIFVMYDLYVAMTLTI